MQVAGFCQKHGLSKDMIYVAKSDGRLPKSIFHRPFNSKLDLIDESYFIRRVEFKRQVHLFNQSMYYLLTEHFSVMEYARAIAEHGNGLAESIYNHLNTRLFALDENSIVTNKVNRVDWMLFRFNRKVMLALNKKFGIKFDVEKILDRRMNDS